MNRPRKDESPADGEALNKWPEKHPDRPGTSPATNDSPRSGGIPPGPVVPLLIWTDGLLFGGFSPESQILNAAVNARPTVGRPSRSRLNASLRCFGPVAYARGVHDTWHSRDRHGSPLGFADRSRNAEGKPLQLKSRSHQVDATQADARFLVYVPTAPIRDVKGKGALYAVVLFALYCREQRIRGGAAQLTDRIAASMLGWPETRVATARRRLLDAGAIRKERDGAGQGAAAIYTVPGAWKGNEPNLDPETGFTEAKTRTIVALDVDDATTLDVEARQAEADEAQRRIEWANPQTREKLRWIAHWLRLGGAERPFADVRRLLDGPLAGITQTASGRGRDTELGPLAIKNREGSGCETGTACPSVPRSPFPYAASLREVERKGSDEAKLREEAHLPHKVAAQLEVMFGRKCGPQADYARDVVSLMEGRLRGALSTSQRTRLADAITDRLRMAQASATDERHAYALARIALRQVLSDDDLYYSLKGEAEDDPDDADGTIAISALLEELINAA